MFTTELFTAPRPAQDWWYYSFATGQHIAFFSARTMAEIGQRCGVKFHSDGYLHMLSAADISDWKYRRVLKKADRGLFDKWVTRLHSRTQDDHQKILCRMAASTAG